MRSRRGSRELQTEFAACCYELSQRRVTGETRYFTSADSIDTAVLQHASHQRHQARRYPVHVRIAGRIFNRQHGQSNRSTERGRREQRPGKNDRGEQHGGSGADF